jgi:beta-galactosidase/beta-glucuronidase
MSFKIYFSIACLFLLGSFSCTLNKKNTLPVSFVQGVRQAEIKLDGVWQFSVAPTGQYWIYPDSSSWIKVNVPGEVTMQGIRIIQDKEYAYRREIQIPADYSGKKVFLYFEAVYGNTKVWVNGKFVKFHLGGFTSWECDITAYVEPGETAVLTLGVTDARDDLSHGSNYAHHSILGIRKDVCLKAAPETYFRKFWVETKFDKNYEHASLNLTTALNSIPGKNVQMKVKLFDPEGEEVSLQKSKFSHDEIDKKLIQIPVSKPLKWDSEHPNLYTLYVELFENDKPLYGFNQKIGFREVELRGKKLYVNGDPVKLRGVAHHEMYPTSGRSVEDSILLKDVKIYRYANMNLLRTSHYCPSKKLLEYCDKYGIYVLEEAPVCFIGTYRFHGKTDLGVLILKKDLLRTIKVIPNIIWVRLRRCWIGILTILR